MGVAAIFSHGSTEDTPGHFVEMLKIRLAWIRRQAIMLVPLAMMPLFVAATLVSEGKGSAGVLTAIAPAVFYGGYAIQVIRSLEEGRLRWQARYHAQIARRVDEFAPDEVRLSKHFFEMRLEEEIKRSRRHRLPLCLVTISTAVGTERTIHTSQLVELTTRVLRAEDVAGRIGRRLFAIYLPHTTPPGANVVIERLERELGESALFGLAYLEGGRDAKPDWLIKQATEALIEPNAA